MHYVYLTDLVVTDQAQVDPFTIFNAGYAAEFIEAPDEVTFGWSFVDGNWIAPAVPEPTPEEIKNEIIQKTQGRLDAFAKTRFYDGILSLCTYATSTNPQFQVEGQYGVTARDEMWSILYGILAAVEGGTRPMPSGYEEIEPELPALIWPN